MRIPRINPRRGLAAGAVAALSVVGISGALWTDQVEVASSVDTGNLTVKLNAGRAYENARTPSQPDPYADCEIAAADDGKSIQVTVTDAYPGMWCRAWFTIKNEGTVGAKVSSASHAGDLLDVMGSKNQLHGVTGTVIQPGASLSRAIDINIPASATEADLVENGTYTYTQTFNFENVTL